MCRCVRATCPQSQWKHLFPSASGDRLCISLLLLALGFFFPSPSITRFVLPTQGQLEDCFQPPVSSPTHYSLLCGWPSAPVRLCIICAVWWLFVHVWESWRKGVLFFFFSMPLCRRQPWPEALCFQEVRPSIHPILMDAISQECSEGIFFPFGTYIPKDSRINWFDIGDAESQESIAYYDDNYTQLVTVILNAPWYCAGRIDLLCCCSLNMCVQHPCFRILSNNVHVQSIVCCHGSNFAPLFVLFFFPAEILSVEMIHQNNDNFHFAKNYT